jgi:hypothetical protein
MKFLIFMIVATLGAQEVNPPMYYPQTYIPVPYQQMQQYQPGAPVVINIINGNPQAPGTYPGQQVVYPGQHNQVNRRSKNTASRLRFAGLGYTGYKGYKYYKKNKDLKGFLKSKDLKIGAGTFILAKPISRIPVLKKLLKFIP